MSALSVMFFFCSNTDNAVRFCTTQFFMFGSFLLQYIDSLEAEIQKMKTKIEQDVCIPSLLQMQK